MFHSKHLFLFKILVCLGSVAASATARAEQPAAPCLAPLPPGDKDPNIRNVSMVRSPDGGLVNILACIVSNQDGLGLLGANFSVFDRAGNLLRADGQTIGALSPVSGGQPDQPRIIVTAKTTIALPKGYTGPLLPTVLVQVLWAACVSGPTAGCTAGPVTTNTFLRDAAVEEAAAMPHRKTRRP